MTDNQIPRHIEEELRRYGVMIPKAEPEIEERDEVVPFKVEFDEHGEPNF